MSSRTSAGPAIDSTESLPSIPGGWATREVRVLDHAFRLQLPADPDRFLDDPQVQAAHKVDEYMPYWSYLWPASIAMSEAILRSEWPRGTKTLELGCGIGLAGLAALQAGLDITFSDYDPVTVDLAVHNARLHGFREARGCVLDWRTPLDERYPIILGCDVVYEVRNHEPILHLLNAMLTSDGIAWIGDHGRAHAATFVETARSNGFRVRLQDERGARRDEPVVGQFQLIVLSRMS